MSNRIDQLFRDSLSEHKVPPSAEAWDKVRSGLSKKNKFVIPWRIAATLLLFGALASTLYLRNRDELSEPQLLTKTNELVFPEKEGKEKSFESATQPNRPPILKATKSSVTKVEVNHLPNHTEAEVSTQKVTNENNELENSDQNNVIITEPILLAQTDKSQKPIVIEFTLESIKKPVVNEVAQLSEEGNSGLKKILEAARDVKNGESDFSIIRETKNQLFALDFRKEKTKRN